MNERDTIKRECADLGLDESRRILCPFCDGGKSKESTLSCRRTDAGVLYNCKRASCGKSGIVGGVPGNTLPSAKRKEKVRSYSGPLADLPQDVYEAKFKLFDIEYETCVAEGIKYAPEIRRVYMPVYDYRHYQIGEILRAVDDTSTKPKALTNKFSPDVPFIHFPLRARVTDSLLVVEDMVSAIKASQVAPAVALLGTHLTEDTIEQFRSIGVKRITIMLDGDGAGITSAFKLHARLNPFFQSSVVVPPKNHDPKHLSYKYLESIYQ